MTDDTETLPIQIDHIVDTDFDLENGDCSYRYNYLLYTFEHPLGIVTARSYLDTSGEVSFLKLPIAQNVDKDLVGILRYLRARYAVVKKLCGSGYVDV